jgi:hypothetical protein
VRYYALLTRVLLEKMSDSFHYFVLKNTFLDLGKLEDDRNESSQVPLCIDANGLAVFETIKGYIDDVLIQKQVLRLFVCENHHKRLYQSVAQLVVLPCVFRLLRCWYEGAT